MMTFSKISIFLIVISAIALAYFGIQNLGLAIDEKQKALEPSPNLESNYFVDPYKKAKNVQQLQDDRFDVSNK